MTHILNITVCLMIHIFNINMYLFILNWCKVKEAMKNWVLRNAVSFDMSSSCSNEQPSVCLFLPLHITRVVSSTCNAHSLPFHLLTPVLSLGLTFHVSSSRRHAQLPQDGLPTFCATCLDPLHNALGLTGHLVYFSSNTIAVFMVAILSSA